VCGEWARERSGLGSLSSSWDGRTCLGFKTFAIKSLALAFTSVSSVSGRIIHAPRLGAIASGQDIRTTLRPIDGWVLDVSSSRIVGEKRCRPMRNRGVVKQIHR
jgi:hypothetical protein